MYDQTHQKQAEEALKKSEERFKQLAEAFPETIFEADIHGNFTYANQHGLNFFGYTQEDITAGVNVLNLILPDDRNKVLQRLQERILSTAPHKFVAT